MASIDKSAARISSLYREAQAAIIKELRGATDFRRAQLGLIAEQIDQVLRQLGEETAPIINEEVRRHYVDGSGLAVKAIQDIGVPIAAALTQFDEEAIRVIASDAFVRFGASIQAAGRTVTNVMSVARRERIRSIIAEGTIGARTRRDISKSIAAEFSDGITALVDRSGKQWSLDTYAEMLARTKMREATNDGLQNRMIQSGVDLVQVSDHNSSHAACAEWEGKILSITGNTPGYKTVEDAKSGGLFHPNCKHRLLPYRKGLAEATGVTL